MQQTIEIKTVTPLNVLAVNVPSHLDMPLPIDRAVIDLMQLIDIYQMQSSNSVICCYDFSKFTASHSTNIQVCIPLSPATSPALQPTFPNYLQLEQFDCCSIQHVGPVSTISDSWKSLIALAQQAGHKTNSNVRREVYHHWITEYSPDNVVELQLMLTSSPSQNSAKVESTIMQSNSEVSTGKGKG